MSNYDKLINSFYNRRRDYSFSSSELDSLTDAERKNVELLIVKNCLDGDTSCFKYIEKLKFYNPSQVFNIDSIGHLDIITEIRLINKLFEVTNDMKYLNYLVELSYKDVKAYSMLVSYYLNKIISSNYYSEILNIYKTVGLNDDDYTKIAKKVITASDLKNIGNSSHYNYRLVDEFSFNHDEELYKMLTSSDDKSSNFNAVSKNN